MDDPDIPHHFICPISLQIMKDPVTVATGITYDRESIQRWQSHSQNNTCPVTNQPLPIVPDYTPNHNLRRLIQSWRVSDQVPANYSSFQGKALAGNLIKNVNLPELKVSSLKSLVSLASESENNRAFLKEVGVVRAMITVIVSCYQNCTIVGLQEALNVVYLVRFTRDDTRSIISKHDLVIHSLTWVLDLDDDDDDDQITTMKLHAIVLLKDIIHNTKSLVLERLNRDFFKTIVLILRHLKINNLEHGIKEVLHVMLTTCTWPRNCSMMIDSGAVFELVELELGSPKKAITELIMAVLFHLCSSADGRAQLLGHAAGIAVITKRITKVSPKVDERALMIISLISKFSGTDWVLKEMVRVGTVEKLCMVLQVNGLHSYPREKAREILKRHSNVWKDSPCLDVTLLTRYTS
ncbi:putative U box domain, armadillo-like helical, Zinc finger, RING/FYVE/PHD-type [Helianthus annuus]|nr:E3 ubiquitin-protein ligase PUB24 [Helianthus annuus]KAJ0489015.1 putative U box domain, armadillo-like helical, Zinc finger, RING/FYVE/PHD-type [Helianthus annuus]KAJ0492685.1 putative U box domain, armadillo-like helical, Zinc finger, RING/FYVE/PHD-type [Helianthus annuus]KAJ0504890.1 putative U box domain, armadillo-like helical, Zinc finger, RING/FYVE/PHD-type [Helianthus annuus]KAJ0674585.1 putative U box domain, armadillo-like helical, Zinc finger, RING/FYVE/PHD-type [Helianthus annuus